MAYDALRSMPGSRWRNHNMKIRPHHLHHMTPRVDKVRRMALYALVALLLITGALWLLFHLNRADDAMPNALEPWLLKIHGGAAMLIIFLSGTLLYGHMLNAWHQGRNRIAGGFVSASFLAVGLSGYGLYYFDGELLRQITEWLHWVIGFGLPLLLWWHVTQGRKARRARAAVATSLRPPL